MRYRALDKDGDYSFGHGSQDFLVDKASVVAQKVLTVLRLFQGEWFLDTQAGIPWLTKVTGTGTRPLYDSVIKGAILAVVGVTEIIDYSSSLDEKTRRLTISMKLMTVFGVIPVLTTVPSGGGVPVELGGYGVGGYGERGYGL